MKKASRAGSHFKFHPVADSSDEDAPPVPVVPVDTSLRHIHFNNTSRHGPSNSRNTYVAGGASPNKIPDTQPLSSRPDDWNFEAAPPEINETNYPWLDPAYQHQMDLESHSHQVPPKARTRTAADDPMALWTALRGEFLAELLRLEGRGKAAFQTSCHHCLEGTPEFRCTDCFGQDLFCQGCLVSRHEVNPLHRVERWTGQFFKRESLKTLGLRVQLGHSLNEHCVRPKRAFGDQFVVIDDHGIHEVNVDFCGCQTAQEPHLQLLRAEWFPATTVDPKTAATFRVLERFHLLTFESKASCFEFIRSIVRETDNTGVNVVHDRYEQFLRMVHEWRHLKMLKRAGRGHDPAGVAATQPGQLAVVCPACPHPDRNLPIGWEDAPKGVRWIYALFLAIDANFRLQRKKVSSDERDPGLSAGWAYFVDETLYKSHLANYGDQEEQASTCVNHDAVKSANTKKSAGKAATGAGTVDCARHNIKRPHSVGDTQHGERFANMDFLFFSSILYSTLLTFVVSYDIACQWSIYLWDRMLEFPSSYHVDFNILYFLFVVPKFHLPAHIAKCQTAFSLNYSRWVGRTDGEAPERGWADINQAASSTKEMGPGSRRDTLDDYFGDWNWKKIVNMPATFLRKIDDAVPARAEHVSHFDELTAALPPASVLKWTKEVEAWEADNTVSNPFVIEFAEMTQQAVKLAMAVEEAEEMRQGRGIAVHITISASILISTGMDLELQQRRLRMATNELTAGSTYLQQTTVQRRETALLKKIEAWSKVQLLYMPCVATIRARDTAKATKDGADDEAAYQIPLYLPSSLPSGTRCEKQLQEYEWRLRYAQANDALDSLRYHLRLESQVLNFKYRFARGQVDNLKSNDTVKRVAKHVRNDTEVYRTARLALRALSAPLGETGWQSSLPILVDADVRQMTQGLPEESEGNRTLSWIWRTDRVAGNLSDEGLQDGIRVEWCKARARAMRWSEEIILLQEEMRRVLAYHAWHARWWDDQSFRCVGLSEEQTEGLAAYAHRQAKVYRGMRLVCETAWRNTAQYCALGYGAGSNILQTETDL